jgi:hypothetical protein
VRLGRGQGLKLEAAQEVVSEGTEVRPGTVRPRSGAWARRRKRTRP